MLKMCARLFGLAQYGDRGSKGKKALQGDASLSVNLRLQYRKNTYNTAVRIVHAGGREELYKHEIPAAKLMEKYPGMCVAKPEVFKHPHQSVLLAEEKLLPGNKYYMIPCTTVKKLKRKHAGKNKVKEDCMSSVESSASDGEIGYSSDDSFDSVCSANDFYMSSERWRRFSRIKSGKGKKPFVPPIRNNNKACRKLGWEPSLDSVQEVSP